MNLIEMVKEGAKIIDVRTPEEFMGGHVTGSVNIPLNEVPARIDEFRAMSQPFILCCLSGGRSGQATNFLQAQGIKCVNGGGWMEVNAAVNQLV
jgi:phage shock protein E